MTPFEVGGLVTAALTSGWLGNVLVEYLRTKSQRSSSRIDADVRLEQHRDSLTIQLLEQARMEAQQLREELHRLRLTEIHALHFEEALRLLDLLLQTPADARKQVENEALAFVNRMKRGREARGFIRNEIQRMRSRDTAK